jgi:4-hydroxybenzoate polyprenyltransferase
MLYGINDFFDRDVDEENPKKDGKEVRYSSSSFVNGVIAASTALAVPVFVILPQRTYVLVAVFLGLSYQYSAPPLRFKTRPFLDSVSNGLYIIPFLATYSYAAGGLPPLTVVAGGWFWAMAMHTFSAIPDIEPDREAGIQTTATYLGRKKVYTYVTAVWTVSAASMALHDFRIGLLFLIYPVISSAVYLLDIQDSRAYWWFPVINAFTGMVITLYGLWVLFNA